jgi:phytoene/squalene synthetase
MRTRIAVALRGLGKWLRRAGCAAGERPAATADVRWLEVPAGAVGRSPSWLRSVGLSRDGRVYLPAAFGGDEAEMALRVVRDGEPAVSHRDHTFVPSDWLARVAPHRAELCEGARKAVVRLFARRDREVLEWTRDARTPLPPRAPGAIPR